MNCLELFDDIVEIYLVEVGEFVFDHPFNVHSSKPIPIGTISNSAGDPFSLSMLRREIGLLVEGAFSSDVRNESVCIESGASVTTSQKIDMAGVYHVVKISAKSCEPIDRLKMAVSHALCADAVDIFIIDSEDNIFVIRGGGSFPHISFSVSLPQGAGNEITIEFDSKNGMQRIENIPL